MTAWTDFVETGVGGDGIEYRLVIEGAQYEICTTEEMAGACTEAGQSGKSRIPGLLREGLGFAESAYLAGADLSVSINAVRVMETPAPYLDAVTNMFTRFADVKTYLGATLLTGATTMTVLSETDLTADTVYHTGTEAVRVTAMTGDLTPTIERAQWRTFDQRHAAQVVGDPKVRPIRDGVNLWSGRRCWLYAHGRNEFGLGDTGELVWRGRLSDEPQLDGGDAVVWNLSVESRWSVFDQEIGSVGDSGVALRGAYYPAGWELVLTVGRSATASKSVVATTYETVKIPAGIYENDELLGEAIATALNANTTISSWNVVFACRILEGRWELFVTTAAADPRYIHVGGGSYVDGTYRGLLQEPRLYGSDSHGVVYDAGPRLGDRPGEIGLDSVAAGTEYICLWDSTASEIAGTGRIASPDFRRMPRTNSRTPRSSRGATDADLAANPVARLYLANIGGLVVGDTILVSQPAPADGDQPPPIAYEIFTVDSTDGYIEAYGLDSAGVASLSSPPNFVAAGRSTPQITAAKRYGGGGTTLDGFRAALVAAAPDGANDGTTPWVLDDDVADWSDVVDDAANGQSWLTSREYVYYKGARTSDILKHEARLYGLFYYLDADFKIAARPLTIDTQSPLYSLSDDDGTLLTSGGFGEMKSGMDGNVNVVELSTGYDPKEDKHTGGTISVVSVEGVSEAKKRRVLDIKPKSRSIGGEPTNDYAYAISEPVRTLFGGKILHYTFDVPITFWPVLVGDTILVTSSTMPYDGHRATHDPGQGMIGRKGLVVAREWDLVEGTGRLTVLVSGLRLSGYAPSGRVASASGAGTAWALTLETQRYAPPTRTDASYFTVGDKIRVVEWDHDTPIVRYGTITSVVGDDVGVTLDSSWTGPGAAIFNLIYQDSDTVTDEQLGYSFVADTDRRVDDGAGGLPAFIFGS